MTSVVQSPHASALTARGEAAFRSATTTSVIVLAILAGVLSYAGLNRLALDADVHPRLAWIFPIVIDGLTFVGSIGVIHAVLARIPSWYPWILTLIGVSVSVIGNVAVSPPDAVSRMVHAAPPIVLALSLEALLRSYRARAHVLLDEQDMSQKRRKKPRQKEPAHSGDPTPATPPAGSPRPVDPFASTMAGTQLRSVPDGNSTPARARIEAMLDDEPDITGAEAARRLGIDPSHARKILRDIRGDDRTTDEQLTLTDMR